jgi:hypothetical protein
LPSSNEGLLGYNQFLKDTTKKVQFTFAPNRESGKYSVPIRSPLASIGNIVSNYQKINKFPDDKGLKKNRTLLDIMKDDFDSSSDEDSFNELGGGGLDHLALKIKKFK